MHKSCVLPVHNNRISCAQTALLSHYQLGDFSSLRTTRTLRTYRPLASGYVSHSRVTTFLFGLLVLFPTMHRPYYNSN
jgi:hypothetical protein